jgi:hypothetical protein
VFSGHSVIAENGTVLAENSALADTGYMLVQDCDLGKIRVERRRNTTFRAAAERYGSDLCDLAPVVEKLRADGSLYPVQKLPFIPSTAAQRKAYCLDIFQLQVTGLKQRLKTIHSNAVIGISGGLDSTLALLVAVEAMRQLDRPLTNVYGVTMPCFGTSDRTYNNSWDLMKKLGIDAKEIYINYAVTGKVSDRDLSLLGNPKHRQICCKLSPLVRLGKIRSIEGLQEIAELKDVVSINPSYEDGDTVTGEGTLKQIVCRFFIVSESKEDLIHTIEEIYRLLKVTDEDGGDMLIGYFDTDLIRSRY